MGPATLHPGRSYQNLLIFLLKIIYSSRKCHIYPRKFMPFESRLVLEVSHYIKKAYSISIICSNGVMKNGCSYSVFWSIPSKFLDLLIENYLLYQKKSYLIPPIHPISIKTYKCLWPNFDCLLK